MKQRYYLDGGVVSLLLQQIILQQQLIAAQNEIIVLQRQIKKMTPKRPKDKDIFWHLVSDGLFSIEAANSDDPITVRQFQDWITQFAKKHIKPYVNEKVYGECLNQMTRGLPERIAELESKQGTDTSKTPTATASPNGKRQTVKLTSIK